MKNFAEKVGSKVVTDIAYQDVEVATNRFTLDSGTAIVIHWGDNFTSTLEMDSSEFEADVLTKYIIMENLNDAQFGVQKIVGADYFNISQIYNVTRTFKDGKIQNFETSNIVIEDGCISKAKNVITLNL